MKKIWPILFVVPLIILLTVFSTLMEELTQLQLKELTSGPAESSPLFWLTLTGLFIISLLVPLVMNFLIFWSLNQPQAPYPQSLTSKINSSLNQTLIEELRGTGRIFSGFLFFIIPGILRYFYYLFISPIVLFDKNYDAGRIDVFKESKFYFKKNKLKVIFLVSIFQFILPFFLMLIFEDATITNPLLFSLKILLQLTIHFIFLFFIYKIFINTRGRVSI